MWPSTFGGACVGGGVLHRRSTYCDAGSSVGLGPLNPKPFTEFRTFGLGSLNPKPFTEFRTFGLGSLNPKPFTEFRTFGGGIPETLFRLPDEGVEELALMVSESSGSVALVILTTPETPMWVLEEGAILRILVWLPYKYGVTHPPPNPILVLKPPPSLATPALNCTSRPQNVRSSTGSSPRNTWRRMASVSSSCARTACGMPWPWI